MYAQQFAGWVNITMTCVYNCNEKGDVNIKLLLSTPAVVFIRRLVAPASCDITSVYVKLEIGRGNVICHACVMSGMIGSNVMASGIVPDYVSYYREVPDKKPRHIALERKASIVAEQNVTLMQRINILKFY